MCIRDSSYIGQNKLPDIHNTEFEKIMQAQRNWQLRRTAVTSGGGFAGYYDMVMSFMVGHTVVKAFIDAGVEEYEFVATIDDRTTKECRELNGKTFKMSELKLGINAPPVYPPPHPCRSVMRVIK